MAQSRDVMIQDFIEAMKFCQCELHCFYLDSQTSFCHSAFSDFDEVIISGGSHTVSHEWMIDLETHVKYLSFRIGYHTYSTHYIGTMK